VKVSPSVSHFTLSTSGGPGLIAATLDKELTKMGVNSEIFSKGNVDLRKHPLSFPLLTLTAATDDFVVRNRGWPTPVSLLRNTRALESGTPALSHRDIIHLHWTQGLLTLDDIEAIPKPVVWTLHDMRPLTGACHQKLGCTRYEFGCTSCPAVRPIFRTMVERQRAQISKLAKAKSDLLFIAPTLWMKKQLVVGVQNLESKIKVIHHAVSVKTPSMNSAPAVVESKRSRKRVAVIGGLYDSELKGLSSIKSLLMELSFKADVTVVGHSKHILPGVKYLPPMARMDFLNFMNEQEAIIIPSLGESFSLVAFEAASLGKVVFGEQGSAIDEVASAYGTFFPISRAAEIISGEWLGGSAKTSRSPEIMAQEYLNVYLQLMSAKSF